MEKKINISKEVLCEGLPKEFQQYLEYCQSLKFEEKPDYDYLRSLFRNVMQRNNFAFDHLYDWNSDTSSSTGLTQEESLQKKIKI